MSTKKFLTIPQQLWEVVKDVYGIDSNLRVKEYELSAPIQELLKNIAPGVYIPISEKGQPNGTATLDASGKVPIGQIPSIVGDFLPITGGTMQGSIDMNGEVIYGLLELSADYIYIDEINTPTGVPIRVARAINMQDNKLVNVEKGLNIDDAATMHNIQDHNSSSGSHLDLRNMIAAIQGTYIYLGKINLDTEDVTSAALDSEVMVLEGRNPAAGDVLIDLQNGEWYYNGTEWLNLGHFDIAIATSTNDGLMTRTDFIKLRDLLDKNAFDNLISTLATKAEVNLKEDKANKATDFSVLNDTKYPTTKAVAERLLNLPIAELNNKSLREVFETYQLLLNNNFDNGTTSWSSGGVSNFQVVNGVLQYNNASTTVYPINNALISLTVGDKFYINGKVKAPVGSNLRLAYTDSSININVSSDLMFYSGITTAQNTITTSFSIRNNSLSSSEYHYVDYVNVINLTSLAISHLTVQQMDYWFSIYQKLKSGEEASILLTAQSFLDMSISKLNNKTLRQVFENGQLISNFQFTNDFVGWTGVNNFNTISTTDYVSAPKSANQTNELQARYQDITGLSTDTFYVSIYMKKTGAGTGARTFIFDRNNFTNGTTLSNNTNAWVRSSWRGSKTNGIRVMIGHYGDNLVVNNFYDDVRVLNLNSLGISSLTLQEMDYYFSLYQALKEANNFDAILKQLDTKANIVQEDWITPTLTSGATGTVKYMKDTLGFVHFKGTLRQPSGGTVSNFILPIGYRTTETKRYPVILTGTINTNVCILFTNGTFYIGNTATDTEVQLDNISFRAEA